MTETIHWREKSSFIVALDSYISVDTTLRRLRGVVYMLASNPDGYANAFVLAFQPSSVYRLGRRSRLRLGTT